MLTLRKASERGTFDHGWLKTAHTFSFADYYDPRFMGFRSLRVINDDVIAAGKGFGTHPHRDMEIVTYVLSGALEHKDSMGTGSVIRAGDVQYMAAGSGVTHSEFNHLKDAPTRLLQIWILPNQAGAKPRYDQKHFDDESKHNRLRLLVSPTGEQGSIAIHQDVKIFATRLDADHGLTHRLETKRSAYLQVATGAFGVVDPETGRDHLLSEGDGLFVPEARTTWDLKLMGRASPGGKNELLLFDLS